MSFYDDDLKAEVLVPMVSDDGKIMSHDESVKNYYKTGKYLGVFANSESATEYAKKLHDEQAEMYKSHMKK